MGRRPGTDQDESFGHVNAIDYPEQVEPKIPGEILYGAGPVRINQGKDVIRLAVVNTADRPVQVGSHYQLAEANPALRLDRDAAWGRRLNILAGASVRFEPGGTHEVELIPIGGQRIVAGLRGECGGKLDD
jgi:urease subunit beta